MSDFDSSQPLIECNNIVTEYPIEYTKDISLTEWLKKTGKKFITLRSQSHKDKYFTALNSVSLNIFPNDKIGLVGKNGAGKSTLLRHLAGIDVPDSGSVIRRGTVAALLDLATGIKADLSGMENIYLRGAILGLKKSEVDSKLEDILNFCELGDFIYAPVRTYSSGMKARIGFAVSVNISPDVLLLDEVINVGDEKFKMKAGNIFEHSKDGSAMVLATHSLAILKQYCNKCIWMEAGKIVMEGPAEEVIDAYRNDAKGSAKK